MFNLKIAQIRGIDLYIHWSFWLLPIYVILTWHDQGLFPLWMHLLLIGLLFVCVVLHEFGHALAAQHFGINTQRITLTPLGGIAQLERMSHKPWEEFVIAIAGPLVNVAIAIGLGIMLGGALAIAPAFVESELFSFVGMLLMLNIVMVVFNMIPAFPMDGGRVLRAILASSMGLIPGTRVAVIIGTVCAIAFGLAGMFFLGNPWLLMIAIFVVMAGHQELYALEMQERRRRLEEERALHVTLALWDPLRRTWVRRTYGDEE